MKAARLLLLLLWVVASVAAARPARADDDGATAAARSHYEMGLKLFDARDHEQALIEFTKANELKSRPAALFMMAQCQYLLGRLKEARGNYQRYVDQNPDGEFAALARDRVEAIDKRPSTFVINAVPDDVTVLISHVGMLGEAVATGQAPNNFSVPRGRYRIDVTKPNYQGQTRLVEVDVAETKALFFKLEPIPARLEIETLPFGATLYVNGNRARNPYRQDVAPGPVEIFAEAPDYEPRSIDLTLAPGEHKALVDGARFQLAYKQRSGRPELLAASAVAGGLFGAGAVVAAIGSSFQDPNVSSVLLASGGAISGGIVGWLIASPIVPSYIPDNQALFIIGGMWIGLADGAAAGVVVQQVVTAGNQREYPCPGPGPCRGTLGDQLRAGFIGSAPGLALGLTGSVLLRHRAPTYGRVALIQSAALGGALSGALTQLALRWKPYGLGWAYTVRQVDSMSGDPNSVPVANKVAGGVAGPGPNNDCIAPMSGQAPCAFQENSVLDLLPGTLIGLNVGLAAGLLGAYLPDQTKYGPSWQRVLLVDAATLAGGVAGATIGCVANPSCLNQNPSDRDRAIVAGAALLGGGIGLVSGLVLTRRDEGSPPPPDDTAAAARLPIATVVPMRDAAGATIPAFAAMGSF
ncbi:MAG TPA: tetratricopeptide repeat protein [Polyangia bacterium]|nr:tetratricopeptide repeat protein [Polyangia bacterium]